MGAGVAVGPVGVGGSVGNGFFVGAGRRVSVGGGASVAGISVGGGASVGINSVGVWVGTRVGRVCVGARDVAVTSCGADAAGSFCATRGVHALESKSAVRHAKSAPLTLNTNNQIRNERIFKNGSLLMITLHTEPPQLRRFLRADKRFLLGNRDLLFSGLDLFQHGQKQTAPRSRAVGYDDAIHLRVQFRH